MAIKRPDLPFEPSALEPHMSAETLAYHHGKHHQAYVDKTNALIEGTDKADWTIDQIVEAAHREGDTPLFNQAAQVWNHSFFWSCLTPDETRPSGALAAAIERDFGGMDAFRDAFVKAATGAFGSGWAWLVRNGDRLEIRTTSNADTPLVDDVTPLLTVDVWEHAYYLDYQNARPAYLEAVFDNLINWDFVSANYQPQDARKSA
jgi:Fe-Mn family superoxide dismutase